MILAGGMLARNVARKAAVLTSYHPRMYQQHNTGTSGTTTDKPKDPGSNLPPGLDQKAAQSQSEADASKSIFEKAGDTLRKGAEDLLSGIKQTVAGSTEWVDKAKEQTSKVMDQASHKVSETVQVCEF